HCGFRVRRAGPLRYRPHPGLCRVLPGWRRAAGAGGGGAALMTYPQDLRDHLATGATTLARCFAVTRKDGAVMGFTDHDRDLSFEGIVFRADSGLTAKAIQQSTGLSVDNTEAFGALKSEAITEADILAGRYDGAEVRGWLVNWADVSVRVLQFRGTLGEVVRRGGGF